MGNKSLTPWRSFCFVIVSSFLRFFEWSFFAYPLLPLLRLPRLLAQINTCSHTLTSAKTALIHYAHRDRQSIWEAFIQFELLRTGLGLWMARRGKVHDNTSVNECTVAQAMAWRRVMVNVFVWLSLFGYSRGTTVHRYAERRILNSISYKGSVARTSVDIYQLAAAIFYCYPNYKRNPK